MMTDPIADMLTCIRNAVRIERPRVEMPLSKVKCGLAEVLKREGYIWDWREEHEDGAPSKQLSIELKYGPNGERVIRHIRRVSKPGRRVYMAIDIVFQQQHINMLYDRMEKLC
jgi:small subunit ribosomal protein S8